MPDGRRYSLTRDEYLEMLARRTGMTAEDFLQRQRDHVVEIARAVLAGTTTILVAARELSGLREIYLDDADDDLLVFIGVDSQTDHLPIGNERRNWSESALVAQDIEIAAAEADFQDCVVTACERLVCRFARTGTTDVSDADVP